MTDKPATREIPFLVRHQILSFGYMPLNPVDGLEENSLNQLHVIKDQRVGIFEELTPHLARQQFLFFACKY